MLSLRIPQALFFLLISLAAVYFSSLLVNSFFDYFFLSARAKGTVFQWEVLEKKGKYPIRASYSFEADGKTWRNSFTFPPPWNWNELSAIDELKEKAQKSWIVWYHPSRPALSVLEKQFPFNLFFRTLICYAVLVYFVLLYRKYLITNRA